MTYRVAVIGAGAGGEAHCGLWAAMPEAAVVGALAESREGAGRIANAAGCPAFGRDEFEAMLRQTRPDIVDLCAPTPLHRLYVERAAAAGKAVFVEAPLARTLADCDSIMAAIERAGVPLMAGHGLRFSPEYASAKRLVEAGGVGSPAAIRTARMAGKPPDEGDGIILGMSVHDFDWLRWTFGPVTRVFAKGLRDYALITLRFESGAVGHVTGSWAHPGGLRTTFEIAGDRGIIEHDSAKSAPLTLVPRTEGAGSSVPVPENSLAPDDDPYLLELRAFVHALQTGEAPPVTADDAREAVRVALAASESLEMGRAVTLA